MCKYANVPIGCAYRKCRRAIGTFAYSYLLIDPLAYWHISILSHWYINFMAIIDIIILAAFGFGRNHRLHERIFVKQFGLSAGADCRSAGGKGFVCLIGSEAVPHVDRLYDSGASTGICPHWLAVPLLFSLVASLLTRAMEAVSLGWLNHWLGAGLGALKYLLLTSLLIGVIEFIDGDNTLISKTKRKNQCYIILWKSLPGYSFPRQRRLRSRL